MKKQKKPIFLIAVLVLVIGVVAAMNSSILTTPTTPEEVAKQQAKDAADAAAAEAKASPQTTVAKKNKKDGMSGHSLVTSQVGDLNSDMPGTNIKPINAVDPKGSKIAAPIEIKGKVVTPDRASTQANSGWYNNK
jgi:hypothetical protein